MSIEKQIEIKKEIIDIYKQAVIVAQQVIAEIDEKKQNSNN